MNLNLQLDLKSLIEGLCHDEMEESTWQIMDYDLNRFMKPFLIKSLCYDSPQKAWHVWQKYHSNPIDKEVFVKVAESFQKLLAKEDRKKFTIQPLMILVLI